MQFKTSLIIFIMFLLVGIFFLVYNNGNTGLIGNTVLNNESMIKNNSTVTEEDILIALNGSLEIIGQMKEDNFSILYVNDSFTEAKRIFEQVKYAEILRDFNSPTELRREAREALRLVDWKDISYANVLVYTSEIKDRQKRAIFIYDSLIATNTSIEDYRNKGFNVSELDLLLGEANDAFHDDRYDESELLLEELKTKLEVLIKETSTFRILQRNISNFIRIYWLYVLIFLAIFGVSSFYFYKKIKLELLKKEIRKLKIERYVLIDLIKKAQVERYKENKISEFVYNIRMEKYRGKLRKIGENLPVLESELRKKGKRIIQLK